MLDPKSYVSLPRDVFPSIVLLTAEIFIITSRLDFRKSLLYGLPKTLIKMLQSVQNAAARLLSLTRKKYTLQKIL